MMSLLTGARVCCPHSASEVEPKLQYVRQMAMWKEGEQTEQMVEENGDMRGFFCNLTHLQLLSWPPASRG